jgi:hypothetical protein
VVARALQNDPVELVRITAFLKVTAGIAVSMMPSMLPWRSAIGTSALFKGMLRVKQLTYAVVGIPVLGEAVGDCALTKVIEQQKIKMIANIIFKI